MSNGSESINNNNNNNNNSKISNAITLKAAVLLCWPNETPFDVVRLIKKGYIEVLIVNQPIVVVDGNVDVTDTAASTSLVDIASQTHDLSNHTNSSNTTTIWKIARQHGKRMIYPNDQLRRKRVQVVASDHGSTTCISNTINDSNSNNNNQQLHYDYEIRSVPMYPIVIVMNKPCGYIVTKSKRESNTDGNNNEEEEEEEDEKSVDDMDQHETTVHKNSSLSIYDLLYTSIVRKNDTLHSIVPYLSQLRAVGRLDKNTEGLLLFTNHGRWNIALTTPLVISTMNQNNNQNNKNIIIWKRYRCYLQNPASESDLEYWKKGGIPFRHMKSKNGIAYSLPALSAEFVSNDKNGSNIDTTTSTTTNCNTQRIPTTVASSIDTFINRPNTIVDVVIGEGKYRQVRRCWESLSNNKVIHLQRISFGPIELIPKSQQQEQQNTLQVGQCRSLSIEELQLLEQYVNAWYNHNPNYN